MFNNIALLTDSYKFTHYKQYPPKTQRVSSYFESRGGMFREQVPFSLQYFLTEYLEGQVVTEAKIAQAEYLVNKHLGPGNFNRAGWEYILKTHGGRLPVSIKAVPEGTVVPWKNVLMTVENTDPNCFWLTNYLETLLVQVWYGTTVATLSREMKKTILQSLKETGDPSLIDFKLHDFGFRGVSSPESAGIGGAAHLVNFKGTDTVAALEVASAVYGADMAGFSIPAAEHSTITSWGRHNEVDAFENMLTQFPEGLVAVVSDSFDIYHACREYWGSRLKKKVLERKGTLVIRPDSGVPEEVVPNILDILGDNFGYTYNNKGFKVLHPNVRVIQGDGIDYESTKTILDTVAARGWSADNLAFGMGGALLQKLNRDTLKFAFKCSSVTIADKEQDVWKSPVGAPWKASKRGRLKLVQDPDCGFRTVTDHYTNKETDQLVEVFRNGDVTKTYSFEEIRARAAVK